MRKKIIFLCLCVVLLFIFTSLSYAGFDPKAKPLREHPDQELLAPANGDRSHDVLLLMVPNWTGLSLFIYVKNDPPKHDPYPQRVGAEEVEFRTNNPD
jgi:hypothetical protein